MSKPAYAEQLQQQSLRHGSDLRMWAVAVTPGQQAHLLGHSPLYAQAYSLGFTASDVMAAFILLGERCPIDGGPLVLHAEVGATSPQSSRRISADRIHGKAGLHGHGECIWVAAAVNNARSTRLDD